MNHEIFAKKVRAVLRDLGQTLPAKYQDIPAPMYQWKMIESEKRKWKELDSEGFHFENEIKAACEAMEKTLKGAGESLIDATLENYVASLPGQKEALVIANRYANNVATVLEDGVNLIFFGTVGTGKDHLMMGIAKRLFANRKTVLWTDGAQLKMRMRDCIGGDDSEYAIIRDHTSPDFLWISDPVIAGFPLTAFQTEYFYNIINTRYSQKKPTLVTLNVHNSDEFNRLLGAPTADRLRANGLAHYFNWPSARTLLSIDKLPEKEA